MTNEELAELLQSDVKKDLHLHTYYSDGVLSPEEVTDRWASEGYKLIAVTDHDGIDGSVIALDYAVAQKILPQISGSGETVEEGLKELKTFAQDKNLNMTASVLDDIIARGENTMNFFQYFG